MCDDGGIGVIPGIFHAQWCKDVLLDKVAVTLPADLFDQVSQQDISGVRVAPLLSRLKVERLIAKAGHQLFRRGGYGFCRLVIGELSETGNARGVREHVEDGYLVPGG